MAIVWLDGFDGYAGDGTDVSSLMASSGYTAINASIFTPNPTISNNTRDGIGFAINPNAGGHGYPCGIVRNFPLKGGIVIGFAFYTTESDFHPILQFGYNDGIGHGFYLANVFANATAGISACVGAAQPYNDPSIDPTVAQGSVIGVSKPNVLFPGTWQYIEIYYKPNAALNSGIMQIKVDGTMVINNTTAPTSIAYTYPGAGPPPIPFNYCNFISFVSAQRNGIQLIDDLYICDLLDTSFNNFLGDVVVRGVFANADAGTNTFTQFGGGSGHFTSIDEQSPDGDVSYLASATSGAEELFTLASFPSDVIDVLAVAVNVRAAKDTAGYAFYAPMISHAGTPAVGDITTVSQTYQTYQTVFQTAPEGSPWTTSVAQATKIGFKIP